MYERLKLGEVVRLSLLLETSHHWRIAANIEAEGEVETTLFRGLDAMREETAGEGRVPYSVTRGSSYSVLTTDGAEGGPWLLKIRSLSPMEQLVVADFFAIPTRTK